MKTDAHKKEISKVVKERKMLGIKLKKVAKGPNPKSIQPKRPKIE